MSPTKTIISKALHLKPVEKSLVIEALLKSLDIPDPKIEKMWAQEAEKRLKAYKAGKLKTVSFEDMFIKKNGKKGGSFFKWVNSMTPITL